MSETAPRKDELRNGIPFVGGRLWLDLLNTTPSSDGRPRDLIATPEGYAAWLHASGVNTSPGATSEAAREDLRDLRETLRGAVIPLQRGDPLPEKVVAAVNRRLEQLQLRVSLERDGRGLRFTERRDPGGAGPAAIIAEDFARFVTNYEPGRLKQCRSPNCTLVFYDVGRNNKRRWCSMRLCGNRDKVARFRGRKSRHAD